MVDLLYPTQEGACSVLAWSEKLYRMLVRSDLVWCSIAVSRALFNLEGYQCIRHIVARMASMFLIRENISFRTL